MAENDNAMSCTTRSWALAIIGGLVIGVLFMLVGGWGFAAAVILAVVIALVVGLFLSLAICPGASGSSPAAAPTADAVAAPTAAASAVAPSVTDAPKTAEAPKEAEKPAASAAADTPKAAASDSAVKPSAPLAGQAELAARKGDWKYEKDSADAPAKKDAPAKAAATASPAVAEPAPAAEAAPAKAKRAPVAADGKPELMDGPRAEGADDLKLISGVGPKLEQTLNGLGIWHFSQVAGWRKKEIAWVDERLRFKGRIERDDWMSQAKILAKGGETEFSKKKKK
ncbi:hypothetical protein A8B82_08060 [Sulfitobacter sp. EhC04]|uniref:hypothetical protein n=1 Tax=Sulfitobacter sp. EhC04 TaxID=1849168 RepID=UPI0007F36501|nr:hypothetical protein [Sulfitobacter sp. EhC04]OAN79333.1 hypothetical protein A8B82_08060 [Sulfitobacter sp. EhC04]